MMTQGYYTGISGIKTYQTAIDITADNLANISTVGFRGSNAEFANLYEHSKNTVHNRESVGIGSRVNATSSVQDAGSLILTDRSTDLALMDEGWFGIKGINNESYFTRAGDFTFDVDNDLVTPDGFYVLGTMAGNINGEALTQRVNTTPLGDVSTQTPLTFPKNLYFPAEPSTKARMIGNIGAIEKEEQEDNTISVKATSDNIIDETEELEATQTFFGTVKSEDLQEGDKIVATVNGVDYESVVDANGSWSIDIPTQELQVDSRVEIVATVSDDLGNPTEIRTEHSARFGPSELGEVDIRSIGAGVVDAQGNKNHLKIEFTPVDTQVLPGSQWNAVATVQSLDGETIYDTQTSIVEFDADGSLKSHSFTTIDNNGTAVEIDLGNGYDGVVSLSNVDRTSSSITDGVIPGDLVGYEISQDAEVIATFTNGMQSSVGKIAVYHFQNDQGLERITGTRFKPSSNSGEPIFYQNAEGENIIGSSIANYRLENSNVRMEVGLTELIIYQRAYDANAKSITTADQMMQKALNMDA